MKGVSLLEILIWVRHSKSGILIPFCLQSQNSTSYQNVNYFYQYPFIYSSYYPKEKKIIQNIYRYIVKNIKKRRFFFYIVREENIRPQVLRDKISPPFFQHYEKNIYRIVSLAIIYSLSINYHHKMTKKNPSSIQFYITFV